MKSNLKKQEKGFTIIEVLIVLAIAGLIMLVVFLAVPSLQRNSRNTQRKNDVSLVTGALQEAINNSNGSLPAAAAAPAVVTQTSRTQLPTLNYAWVASGAAATALPATINPDTILIRNGMKCNDANGGGTAFVDPGTDTTTIATTVGNANTNIATLTGATSRTAVVIYSIERNGGFVAQCQNL